MKTVKSGLKCLEVFFFLHEHWLGPWKSWSNVRVFTLRTCEREWTRVYFSTSQEGLRGTGWGVVCVRISVGVSAGEVDREIERKREKDSKKERSWNSDLTCAWNRFVPHFPTNPVRVVYGFILSIWRVLFWYHSYGKIEEKDKIYTVFFSCDICCLHPLAHQQLCFYRRCGRLTVLTRLSNSQKSPAICPKFTHQCDLRAAFTQGSQEIGYKNYNH